LDRRALGVRVAPVRGHRQPVPLYAFDETRPPTSRQPDPPLL